MIRADFDSYPKESRTTGGLHDLKYRNLGTPMPKAKCSLYDLSALSAESLQASFPNPAARSESFLFTVGAIQWKNKCSKSREENLPCLGGYCVGMLDVVSATDLSVAYSLSASFRTGMFRSASFHRARKSW